MDTLILKVNLLTLNFESRFNFSTSFNIFNKNGKIQIDNDRRRKRRIRLNFEPPTLVCNLHGTKPNPPKVNWPNYSNSITHSILNLNPVPPLQFHDTQIRTCGAPKIICKQFIKFHFPQILLVTLGE